MTASSARPAMLRHLPGIHAPASHAEAVQARLADRAAGRNPYSSFFSYTPEGFAEARARIEAQRSRSHSPVPAPGVPSPFPAIPTKEVSNVQTG